MDAGFNYSRFYALLQNLPGADKEELVYQFTQGRTTHLHLMVRNEYDKMCDMMAKTCGCDEQHEKFRKELRKARSGVLHQMQLLGIDTSDWARVDAFCKDARIACQEFRKINIDDLNKLNTKLRVIRRKGGLKNEERRMKNEELKENEERRMKNEASPHPSPNREGENRKCKIIKFKSNN